MKKKKLNWKLALKKERIVALNAPKMNLLYGGGFNKRPNIAFAKKYTAEPSGGFHCANTQF